MTILLVIDVQEKYMGYYDGDLLEEINKRIEEAKAKSEQIIYVRNISMFGNTEGYELAKNHHVESELVFDKRKPSAFTNEAFCKALKAIGETSIEIIGVDGNCCVKKTAIDAKRAGYEVSLNTKCIGFRSPQITGRTLDELSKEGVKIK